jgi:hypothetical protein
MTARAYHCRDGIEDDIHLPNLFFKPGSPIAIASSHSEPADEIGCFAARPEVGCDYSSEVLLAARLSCRRKEGDQDLRPAGSGPRVHQHRSDHGYRD